MAEALIRNAGKRVLPVSIYRPARIIGHRQADISNVEDLLALVMKGCVQLGETPQLSELEDNITPVDYVGRAIVALSRQPATASKVFHVTNPSSIPWDHLFNYLHEMGYPLEQVFFIDWCEAISQQPDNPLLPLLPLLHQQRLTEKQQPVGWPRFDCKNTLDVLLNSDISCSAVDDRLLNVYFSYFKSAGLFDSA